MHTDLKKRWCFLFWEPCQAVWEWDDVARQTWEFLCDLAAKSFILWHQSITLKLCMDSKFLLFLGCWMSRCGNWCFTPHAWNGIPKSSCHVLSLSKGSLGMKQLRGVLEGCHLVPVVISDTFPCAPCVSKLEKQLCCLGQVQLGSPAPQQE